MAERRVESGMDHSLHDSLHRRIEDAPVNPIQGRRADMAQCRTRTGGGGGITDLWFLAEIEAWERNGSMILTTSFNTAGEILKGLI